MVVGGDGAGAEDAGLEARGAEGALDVCGALAAVVAELLVGIAGEAEGEARGQVLQRGGLDVQLRRGLVVGGIVLGAEDDAGGAGELVAGLGVQPGGGDDRLQPPDVLADAERVDLARRDVDGGDVVFSGGAKRVAATSQSGCPSASRRSG